MKTYSTRSNAKAGIIATDVGINVVPNGARFGLEAMLPSGATDALQTRLDELGFRTVRPAVPDPLPETSRKAKKSARSERKAKAEASRSEVAKVKAERKVNGAAKTKKQTMLDMICRKHGATALEITEALGWQPAGLAALGVVRAAEEAGIEISSQRDEKAGRLRYFGAPRDAA